MSRLNQIIRNSFIRFEGWLYQFANFLKNIFGWLSRLFSFLAQISGFSKLQYFLEGDEATGIKRAESESKPKISTPPAPPASVSSPANANRRRPDASMEYYRKLAQQQKN